MGEDLNNIFIASVCGWALAESWIWWRERGKIHTTQDKNSKRIIVLCVGIGIYGGIFLSHVTSYPLIESSKALILGSTLLISAVSFRIWSVITLGNFFRTTVM